VRPGRTGFLCGLNDLKQEVFQLKKEAAKAASIQVSEYAYSLRISTNTVHLYFVTFAHSPRNGYGPSLISFACAKVESAGTFNCVPFVFNGPDSMIFTVDEDMKLFPYGMVL
jgi:hypothetical protein